MKKLKFIGSLVREANEPDGTFVGVHLSEDTKNALHAAAKEMGVPNIIDKDAMHITVIYSRKHLPNFKPRGKIDPPIVCVPEGLEIFTGQDGKTKALVVRMECPELLKRHEQIMEEHQATYDFDEYKPHVTLSYDCGDFDVDANNVTEHMEKPYIEIMEEYSQDLDLNWAKKN